MGLPVNNFTFWAYLESGEKEDPMGSFKEIKETFSLYGYIIHNPEEDNDFNKLLNSRFDQLSRISGEYFLFTAFVNPPSLNTLEKKSDRVSYLAKGIVDQSNILKSDTPSFNAFFVSESLGINPHSIPYIIIADNPKSKVFYFIELNKDNLIQVMSDLTEVATFLKHYKSKLEDDIFKNWSKEDIIKLFDLRSFEELIKGLPYKIYEVELKEPLSRKLLKISLSLQNFTENKIQGIDAYFEKKLLENGLKELSKVQKLEFIAFSLVQDFIKSNGNTSLKDNPIAFKHELLSKIFDLNIVEFQDFKDCLETETFSILLDGALLYQIFDENIIVDCSPFIIPFGKAFEMEMTASLVHWIRDKLKIDLPEFYYQYQPGVEAILINNNFKTNFNELAQGTNVWKPPTIGGQIHGLKNVSKEFSTYPFSKKEERDDFLKIGFHIMEIRNQASHIKILKADSLKLMIANWKILFKKGYLTQLKELKKRYQPPLM